MLPKRRFRTVEQTVRNVFSTHFSTFLSPNRVLTPLESASKTRYGRFVQPSKIFVWDSKFIIVASKKSHFQPSVEMGRKNVDKKIDKHNKQ